MTVRLRPSRWIQRLLGALMVIALGYISLATSCAGGAARYEATLGLASSPTSRSQRVLATFFSDRAPDFWLVRTLPERPVRVVSPDTARLREADEFGNMLVADAGARPGDASPASGGLAAAAHRVDCLPDICTTVLLEVELPAESTVRLEVAAMIDFGCSGSGVPWFELTLTPIATP